MIDHWRSENGFQPERLVSESFGGKLKGHVVSVVHPWETCVHDLSKFLNPLTVI